MIRKKYLLEKIKILERQVNESIERDILLFEHLAKAAEHEIKYCIGPTKQLYQFLLQELYREPLFRTIINKKVMTRIKSTMFF